MSGQAIIGAQNWVMAIGAALWVGLWIAESIYAARQRRKADHRPEHPAHTSLWQRLKCALGWHAHQGFRAAFYRDGYWCAWCGRKIK